MCSTAIIQACSAYRYDKSHAAFQEAAVKEIRVEGLLAEVAVGLADRAWAMGCPIETQQVTIAQAGSVIRRVTDPLGA